MTSEAGQVRVMTGNRNWTKFAAKTSVRWADPLTGQSMESL